MERRVLLAITLSFLVLFLFQRFVAPPPEPATVATNQSAATSTAPSTVAPANQSPSTPSSVAPPAPAAAGADLVVGDTADREIIVDTTTVRAVFTNRGARLLHWTLKSYKNDLGAPLELVPGGAGPEAIKPFTLAVDDAAVTQALNNSLYQVGDGAGSAPVDATKQAATVTFEMTTSDGLSVKKSFTFQPAGYVLSFGAVIERGGQRLNPSVQWGPGLGDDIARAKPASFFSPSYNTPAQAIIHVDGKVERLAVTTAGSQEGANLYAGVDDHYFVSMLLNDEAGAPFQFRHAPVVVPSPTEAEMIGRYVDYSVRYQVPRDSMRFYFGPKALDELRAINSEAVRVINYGIFSWLAVPLLGGLKWVHQYVGNWGWSIVVLTFLINLAMFPLRQMSVVSMRKMQAIQPQMKAIQDRYAKYKVTDPERQKMNAEVMALYKAKGVNPAAGCVPMLLTLPFLFAFYQMLSQSIEIRGAHFTLWLTNLSAPDPWFIMPVLNGAAQFWQQKMTPSTMDPAQAKVMMFMPIMFMFMFLWAPAGLALYWLVSNVWQIGQQYATNYMIGPPTVRHVRPAAERLVKRVGGGKTDAADAKDQN
jgi:YidC/Oxa1 family membrane protein insertase